MAEEIPEPDLTMKSDERAATRSNERTSSRSVDEARARILQAIEPLDAIRAPLDRALGLVLAQDVSATHDNPPFDNAAMDGFACRAIDISRASPAAPVVLPVETEIVAGGAMPQ